MSKTLRRTLVAAAAGIVVLGGAASAMFYLEARERPAEAARLVAELGVGPGTTVAEIGAGNGALAVEVARLVGQSGQVIATELGEDHLSAIRDAGRRARLANLTVVPAAEHETNLPAGSCDAIFMQRVYHHLADPAGVIASARRALKPGGRLAIIDFEPHGLGSLWGSNGGTNHREGIAKEVLVREMQSFGLTLRDGFVPWGDNHFLAVFTVAEGSSSPSHRLPTVPMLASAGLVRAPVRE